MSNHRIEIIRVDRIEPHPNADSLGIVRAFGYTVCVRLGDFHEGDLAAYVIPDSVVDASRPEFAFLAGHERIRVKRLRGVVSQGLLVRAPEGSREGDDVAELLGVTHYEPPVPASGGGEAEAPPAGYRPVYDVENFRRYDHLFEPSEPLVVTEKLDGANARFSWQDGRLWAGSRTEWKRPESGSVWWRAVAADPSIEAFCREHPSLTLYGEVYGHVQKLRYGTAPGEVRFAAFDLLETNGWLSHAEARDLGRDLPWVPIVAEREPFDPERLREMAEGPSLVPGAGHLREGIVAKPLVERTHPEIGRVMLKVVSNAYLEKH